MILYLTVCIQTFSILDVYLEVAGLKYKLNQPLLLLHDPWPFKICICWIPIEHSRNKMILMKNQTQSKSARTFVTFFCHETADHHRHPRHNWILIIYTISGVFTPKMAPLQFSQFEKVTPTLTKWWWHIIITYGTFKKMPRNFLPWLSKGWHFTESRYWIP